MAINAIIHPFLASTQTLLRGKRLTLTCRAGGRRYKLESTEDAEEDWIVNRTGGMNMYQTSRNRRKPALATCLVAMGEDAGGESNEDKDHPAMLGISEMFAVPDTKEARDYLKDPTILRVWRWEQVLAWLEGGGLSLDVVGALYDGYLVLDARRQEATRALGPFAIVPPEPPPKPEPAMPAAAKPTTALSGEEVAGT